MKWYIWHRHHGNIEFVDKDSYDDVIEQVSDDEHILVLGDGKVVLSYEFPGRTNVYAIVGPDKPYLKIVDKLPLIAGDVILLHWPKQNIDNNKQHINIAATAEADVDLYYIPDKQMLAVKI